MGRYSFLGTSAKTHVRVYSDSVEIEENGKVEKIPHDHDPLQILKDLMARYKAAEIKELPRFWGVWSVI